MQLYSSFPNEMIQTLPTMDSFKVSGSFGSIAITSSTRNEDPLFEEKLAGMFGQVECQLQYLYIPRLLSITNQLVFFQ